MALVGDLIIQKDNSNATDHAIELRVGIGVSLSKRFSQAVIARRWLVIFTTLLICLPLGFGVKFLTISQESRDMFGPKNPQLRAFEELEQTFTRVENIFFVLAPKEGDIFTPETLLVIENLTEEAWTTEYVNRVDSVTNYQHTVADDDDLLVDKLIPSADNLSVQDLDRIRTIALNEPLILNRLVSEDGRVAGINIDLHFDGEKDQAVKKANWAWAKKDQLIRDYDWLNVYVTGSTIISASFAETGLRDLKTQTPLMYIFVITLMVILLRAISGVIAIVVTTFLTLVSAMGLAGWLGLSLTPISSNIPVIILTVVVAHGIHLMVAYYQGLRKGSDKNTALMESIIANLQPIFLTSLSTAIGFFSLNVLADVPPIQQIGNIVGFAVCLAFFLSLTFLPAFTSVLPNRVGSSSSRSESFMETFADWVIRNRNGLFVGTSLTAIFLMSLAPLNVVSDQFSKYFAEGTPIRTDTDFTDENLGGLYRIEYSLDTKKSQGVTDPEYLNTVEKFAQWYREQEHVTHVNTYTDVLKQLNQRLNSNQKEYYKVPETKELSSQYLLLYELSLPLGLDLNNMLSFDKSASRMIVSLPSLKTYEFIEIQEKAKNWLKENSPDLFQEGSALSLMFTHIGIRTMLGGVKGAFLALFLITIALMISFRSIKMGLVSVLPNLLPGATGFGVWYLLSGEVGFSLAMVLGITMGIVVDDTVHFLTKYLRARETRSPEDAVRYAFSSVGVALAITTLVLVVGFSMLGISDFKMNSDPGCMVGIVIMIALLFDFLLLPPLLINFDRFIYRHAKSG